MSEKEKLNMALDDVIKLSKNSSKRGSTNRGGRKGLRKGPQNQRRPNRFFRGRGGGNRGSRSNIPQGQNNFRRRQFNRPNKPSFKKVTTFQKNQFVN